MVRRMKLKRDKNRFLFYSWVFAPYECQQCCRRFGVYVASIFSVEVNRPWPTETYILGGPDMAPASLFPHGSGEIKSFIHKNTHSLDSL
jgi:hypothetical protein